MNKLLLNLILIEHCKTNNIKIDANKVVIPLYKGSIEMCSDNIRGINNGITAAGLVNYISSRMTVDKL